MLLLTTALNVKKTNERREKNAKIKNRFKNPLNGYIYSVIEQSLYPLWLLFFWRYRFWSLFFSMIEVWCDKYTILFTWHNGIDDEFDFRYIVTKFIKTRHFAVNFNVLAEPRVYGNFYVIFLHFDRLITILMLFKLITHIRLKSIRLRQ